MAYSCSLALKQALYSQVVTITPDLRADQAVFMMSEKGISYLLITCNRKILGIFTERDVVRWIAQGVKLEEKTIGELMTRNIIKLIASQGADILDALKIMRENKVRHLPVEDEDSYLIGILTHESIRKTLHPTDLVKLLRVEELMEINVIQCPIYTSLLEVTKTMTEHRVSCIVITELRPSGLVYPVGIITERDVVQFQILGLSLTEEKAENVMSSPIKTITPYDSLWLAHEKMQNERIRRLIVVGYQGELRGIITLTNLIQALDPLEARSVIISLQGVIDRRTQQLEEAKKALQLEVWQRQSSEYRYRTILDDQTELLCRHLPTGELTFVNQAFCYFWHQQKSDLIEQNFIDLLPHHLRENYWQELLKLTSKNPTYSWEYEVILPKGEKRWLHQIDRAIFDPKGDCLEYQSVGRDITDRKEMEKRLHQQYQQEQLLQKVALKIHQSLHLPEILETTVAEIRAFFKVDRVLIYQLETDCSGIMITESVESPWRSILGLQYREGCCVKKNCFDHYKKGSIHAVNDIYSSGLNPNYIGFLEQLAVRASLIVPLFQGTQLWGLLIAHQCVHPRIWTENEVKLWQHLATQLSIAIQQAELYQKLAQANEKLNHLAHFDALTNIANRRYFDDCLQQQWNELAIKKQPLSLILCDIDCFKAYNDHYGHQKGDHALRQVAQTIQEGITLPSALVARYGGEEFAVILPNCTLNSAIEWGEAVRNRLLEIQIPHANSEVTLSNKTTPISLITLSLGVSCHYPTTKYSPERLIGEADTALYRAKHQGRNQIIAYEWSLF